MAYLRWPATAVTVFWVLCVQVVISRCGGCSRWSARTASSAKPRCAG
ncbi:hypothetical protein [Amycolatopsis methanolica]